MNALDATGVAKDYGSVRALDGIDLALAPGTLTLLRGANGAGKSTLLRVLGALTRPTRGSVRVLGRDPFANGDPAVRARVGFLGQDAALYGELTVVENLRFAARLRGADDASVGHALESLGLEPVRERRARTLSQGFRRRAGLARALLGEPALLLLDEPWNGLDASSAANLSRLLESLRARGVAVLVASHGVGAEPPKFDRELALERGRLL
ncbi:MAG TPA: ABC transporter ATP-binding protein [Myxococcota bacterium]|nr:ABC transporter ATP-binding protein [Myxococcota bacterium]